MGVVNEVEMRVVGMSRSGNHAIIDWILAEAAGRYCFLNCAEPKYNPFTSARPLEDTRSYRVNYAGFSLKAEARGRFSKKDLLLYSYEDVYLGGLIHPDWQQQHDAWTGASARRVNVLILRDPFNLFASRIQSQMYAERIMDGRKLVTNAMAMRIWKQHARDFIGARRILPHPRVGILYNRWARSRRYREEIAGALGMPLVHDQVRRVARTAGGSSFEGLHFDGDAQQMPIQNRWRKYLHDPEYLRLFDDEAFRLAEAAFGKLAAADAVRARQAALAPPG